MNKIIYTTAPKRYDYGSTEELFANVGICNIGINKDKPIRMVDVPVEGGFGHEAQSARYGSGLFFSRDLEGFNKELKYGGVTKQSTSWRMVQYGRGKGVLMGATLRQGVIDFWGGSHGKHSIYNDGDLRRINAHWIGYVKNTIGKSSPMRITRKMLNMAELRTGVELSQ